ncbi:MAG: MBL fold metallo-hydrolase [Phycisphaerales bacterium]|nr:MBL fold metallo-hydrolase [Phycisphaerales bacterium]
MTTHRDQPFLVVLGVAQDAGAPQVGCRGACCASMDPTPRRYAAALAIVDPSDGGGRWLIDATPDFREQMRLLDAIAPAEAPAALSGILLTHAHIGHYTGLMFLGCEAMGVSGWPVHVMPRMRAFLESNGPWDELVRSGAIVLRSLAADTSLALSARVRLTPLLVPHRDEYSETVGFRIESPGWSALWIPDIDAWDDWDGHPGDRRLEAELARVDVAYLDGTFHADGEIVGRDASRIPHPRMVETMSRLSGASSSERAKVRFVHLNHTNPALDGAGVVARAVDARGFGVATQGEVFPRVATPPA